MEKLAQVDWATRAKTGIGEGETRAGTEPQWRASRRMRILHMRLAPEKPLSLQRGSCAKACCLRCAQARPPPRPMSVSSSERVESPSRAGEGFMHMRIHTPAETTRAGWGPGGWSEVEARAKPQVTFL